MRTSERYLEQAETVMRLAAKASSDAERDVYLSIAEGWRKLAAEADRGERHVLDDAMFMEAQRSREG